MNGLEINVLSNGQMVSIKDINKELTNTQGNLGFESQFLSYLINVIFILGSTRDLLKWYLQY